MWLPINGRSILPDICLVSNEIALHSVSTSLISDHFSILITINSEMSTIDGPRQTCITFKKAVWARYAEAGETSQEDLPESSEYGQWPLHSGRPHSTLPANHVGVSQIARR